MNELLEDLAHTLYDEYCAAVGGKAFNGDPLPHSAEFFSDPKKAKQTYAWRVTAQKAIEQVIGMLDEEVGGISANTLHRLTKPLRDVLFVELEAPKPVAVVPAQPEFKLPA